MVREHITLRPKRKKCMLKKYYKLRHMLCYAGNLRKEQHWHHIAAGDRHRMQWAGQNLIAATLR